MENKTKLKVISVILHLFICLPIWFYLLYKILKAIQATELMMFLFWVYLPLTILITIILKLAED